MTLAPWTLLAIVAATGACALTHETAWLKQASLITGHTAMAATSVLTAFMAGLSLGSRVVAGLTLHRAPLLVFGILEVAIGVGAPFVPGLMNLGPEVARLAFPDALPESGFRLGLETLWIGLVLCVPATLMGATLPLVAADPGPTTRTATAPRLGSLYAANNLGAVAGTVAAGFWLIPALGLTTTIRVAGVLEALIGLAVTLWVWPGRTGGPQAHGPADGEADGSTRPGSAAQSRGGGPAALIALSGMAAMIFEMALMKLLPLVIGSSTYSFSLILGGVIGGVGVGSALGGALSAGGGRSRLWMGLASTLAGLSILVVLMTIGWSPELYIRARMLAPGSFWLFQAILFGLCAAYAAVPSVAFGMMLPLSVQVESERSSTTSAMAITGRLYAISTAGNIVGTVGAGLVALPILGSQRTLELSALVLVLAGVRQVWSAGAAVHVSPEAGNAAAPALHPGPLRLADPGERGVTALRGLVPCTAGILATIYIVGGPWLPPWRLTSGVFHHFEARPELAPAMIAALNAPRNVLFHEEDSQAVVTVEETGPPLVRTLRVNGKPDASTGFDMPNQKLAGHLPMLLHPTPRRALLIGFGSGTTAASMLMHGPEQLDVVELSQAVVNASRHFLESNRGCITDRRLHMHIDDGRRFLERTRQLFDVIVSEPSNPWMAGVANLYTVESFRSARRSLAAGGLMLQWMQTYAMDDATFAMIIRTFREVFPHVTLLRVRRADIFMLGSMEPIRPDFARMTARLGEVHVRSDLSALGIENTLTLVGHQLIADDDLLAFLPPGPIHTDDHPRLEYLAPIHQYNDVGVTIPEDRFRGRSSNLWVRQHLTQVPWTVEDLSVFCQYFRTDYLPGLLASLMQQGIERGPSTLEHRALLAFLQLEADELSRAIDTVSALVRDAPESEEFQRLRLRIATQVERGRVSLSGPPDLDLSLEACQALVRLRPLNPEHHLRLGTLLHRLERWGEAEAAFQTGLDLAKANDHQGPIAIDFYRLIIAECRLRRGDIDGVQALAQALEADGAKLKPHELDMLRQLHVQIERARRAAPPSVPPSALPRR